MLPLRIQLFLLVYLLLLVLELGLLLDFVDPRQIPYSLLESRVWIYVLLGVFGKLAWIQAMWLVPEGVGLAVVVAILQLNGSVMDLAVGLVLLAVVSERVLSNFHRSTVLRHVFLTLFASY